MSPKRRKEDDDAILGLWERYKPYWHFIAFVVVITFIGATRWTPVEANSAEVPILKQDIAKIKEDVAVIKDRLETLIKKER